MSLGIPCNLSFEDAAREDRRGALLGPLAVLARQRKMWSPQLLVGALWRAVTNINRCGQILRVLRLPEYKVLARGEARFAFKYLTRGYLSWNLTVSDRAACFERHYLRLRERMPGKFLESVLKLDVPLLTLEESEERFDITLGLPHDHDKEGELSLNLVANGQVIYILSFTIVPGRVLGSAVEDVFLVSRMQGVKGFYKQIQRATKAMREVAPGALLVAALQGLGEAWEIKAMACVRAQDQHSYCAEYDRLFRANYDDFFLDLGAQKTEAGFYLAPIPLQEKPLFQIKQGHKLRTREKREFKRKLAEMIEERVREKGRASRAMGRPLLVAAAAEVS